MKSSVKGRLNLCTLKPLCVAVFGIFPLPVEGGLNLFGFAAHDFKYIDFVVLSAIKPEGGIVSGSPGYFKAAFLIAELKGLIAG